MKAAMVVLAGLLVAAPAGTQEEPLLKFDITPEQARELEREWERWEEQVSTVKPKIERAAQFVAKRRGLQGDEAEAVRTCLVKRAIRSLRTDRSGGQHVFDRSETAWAVALDGLLRPAGSDTDAPDELQSYGRVSFCVQDELVRIEARCAGLSD